MAKPTKDQMLASRPTRLTDAKTQAVGEGQWQLKVPLRPKKWASWILRVPQGATRTFELDVLGKTVWDACDGKTSVEQIIRKLAGAYNLNQREAEVATIAFLDTLTRKGLIAMVLEKKALIRS